MALRFRGSVLRLAENYRVTCAGDSVPRRRRAPPNPCRRCGAWWGPSSGRNRHPHMALRFRGSVLRPTENHRVTCAGKTIAHSATPFVECDPATERMNRGSPSAAGGAWWGPSSGRNRHPHMALRFRGSVLRLTENHRVTCAGGSVARPATPVVECGPTVKGSNRAERGFALRRRWRMVGPAPRPKPASPHVAPLPGKRATAGGKLPCPCAGGSIERSATRTAGQGAG